MALLDKFFASRDSGRPVLRQIGGCKLLEKLAEGPMSTIFLGQDSAGQPVAVKVLSAHGNRIAEKLSVKLGKPWEGERAMSLTHPNVVRTFSCGKEKGSYCIVMEYLPGGNLAEHIRERTPRVMARRLDILLAATNGLAYVHEKGIIHRDICPKNLMFDKEGTVKLIDFGVAIHKEDRLKPAEVRTGRPSYLAPELIRHNHFSVQTDIYAFGVMLYEAFTGQRPFLTDDREELMKMHLRAEVIAPSRIDPALPAVVDPVVLKALDKLPQQRYSSMREVMAALTRLKGLVT